jgi:hypothetical protein
MMKNRPEKVRAVGTAEKTQVRARKVIGHEFGLTRDAHGRERLVGGTAESKRRYDLGSGGKAVRVRNTDPLLAIPSLTPEQRRSGQTFRGDFEAGIPGIRGVFLEERVDGGRVGGGLPATLLGRGQAFQAASRAVGHAEITRIVVGVCIAGHSIKALAAQTGDTRDVVVKLLKIGLDNLAVHYNSSRSRRGG